MIFNEKKNKLKIDSKMMAMIIIQQFLHRHIMKWCRFCLGFSSSDFISCSLSLSLSTWLCRSPYDIIIKENRSVLWSEHLFCFRFFIFTLNFFLTLIAFTILCVVCCAAFYNLCLCKYVIFVKYNHLCSRP